MESPELHFFFFLLGKPPLIGADYEVRLGHFPPRLWARENTNLLTWRDGFC